MISGGGSDKIINAQEVTVLAGDQIQIGDTVYTVENTGAIYGDAAGTLLSSSVFTCAFSPDGGTLVLGGTFSGYAKVYSVSGTKITFVSDLYADAGGTALNSFVRAAAFSPDGGTFVLGGGFSGFAKVYSVSGTKLSFVGNIPGGAGTTALSDRVFAAAFAPGGGALVLGGYFSGYAKVYSVSGTTITFVSNIYADAGTTALSAAVKTVAIYPDGGYAVRAGLLVLGGQFAGKAKSYTLSGTTVTYNDEWAVDSLGTAVDGNVNIAIFSPDGEYLFLGGEFTGKGRIFKFSANRYDTLGGNITYANAGTQLLSGSVTSAAFSARGRSLIVGGATGGSRLYSLSGYDATFQSVVSSAGSEEVVRFSPDGGQLILGGSFAQKACWYRVKERTADALYAADMYADTGNTTNWGGEVKAIAFSPDGSTLVLGGAFYNNARIYSISGVTNTYVGNIYQNWSVHTAAFSPDGSLLVLGGSFTGRAKVYAVSGTTVTYTGDLYADALNTAFDNSVHAASFSPDGGVLVLGGYFTRCAKIYSASGTTIRYVGNIYADAGTGSLDYNVLTAVFSPNGASLVLGGATAGKAKVYAVSGTSITFVSNIYADAGTSSLGSGYTEVKAAAFSPDGTALVLGGDFTYCAKIYKVAGTSITFVRNLTAESGATLSWVYSAAFSPDGSVLALGWGNTGSYTYGLKAFKSQRLSTILSGLSAHPAPGGVLSLSDGTRIGYATKKIDEGGTGVIKTIGTVNVVLPAPPEPWTPPIVNDGAITPTGSYASATYYNLAYGVKLGYCTNGDILVSMKGGTSTGYENIDFTLPSPPAGVTLTKNGTTYDTSDPAGNLFVCVISGLKTKHTMSITMSSYNGTYDYVTAAITLTAA